MVPGWVRVGEGAAHRRRRRPSARAATNVSWPSALQIERAAHPDRSVMGREPASCGPPPGIARWRCLSVCSAASFGASFGRAPTTTASLTQSIQIRRIGRNTQGTSRSRDRTLVADETSASANCTRTRRSCPGGALWIYPGGHGHRVHHARPRPPRAAVHAARAGHRRHGQPRQAHGSRACRHLHL